MTHFEILGDITQIEIIANAEAMNTQFVICIENDDPDLLTPRMIYQVLPDESAAASHYLRVIDNEGEDYLYPEEYFLRVSFSNDIEYTLLHVFSMTKNSEQQAILMQRETVLS